MPATAPGHRAAEPVVRRTSRAVPVVAVVVAAIVVAAGAALLFGGKSTSSKKPVAVARGVEQTRPVVVAGPELAALGDGRDSAIGQMAPGLTGARFDGTPVSISADGKAKLVMFVAHWCPHCQREVPIIAKWLHDEGQPTGVSLYAVATGTTAERDNYPPSAWLTREKLDVPTLADDRSYRAGQAFGLSAYPFFVAIDSRGRVVARSSGELTIADLNGLLDKARKGADAA